MRRTAALATVLLSGAGCGGGEKESARVGSDQAARSTMTSYFEALAARDGQAACNLITEDERERLLSKAAAPVDCPAAVTETMAALPRYLRRSLADVRIGPATVEGDRATVTVAHRDLLPDGKDASLVANDGQWLIDDLPNPSAGSSNAATTCVVSGFDGWRRGQVDAFWHREGQADFEEYLRRFCERIAREVSEDGELSEQERSTTRKIMQDVIRGMVREGRIDAPRG